MFENILQILHTPSYQDNRTIAYDSVEHETKVLFCFLVTPINQVLIILGRCTLYTPVCFAG